MKKFSFHRSFISTFHFNPDSIHPPVSFMITFDLLILFFFININPIAMIAETKAPVHSGEFFSLLSSLFSSLTLAIFFFSTLKPPSYVHYITSDSF